MPNIDGLVWLGYLTHVSEDISAPHTQIYLSIAPLEPCCKAGQLNTIKPIFKNILFWPKGGLGRFLGSMSRGGFDGIWIISLT